MRRAPLLATALLALALAGCSSTPADSDPAAENSSPAVAAASGETITGEGYTYSVPAGWDVPADESIAAGADSFAADLEDADGFADNVNVIVNPAGEVTPDQVEEGAVTELEGAGATDVQVLDRIDVAGSESAHIAAVLGTAGTNYQIDQFYLVNDGKTFIVTFSFSDTVTEADRSATAESVLASWQWA